MKNNGIQAVKFRVTLNGHGVVNYDSKDQKFFINVLVMPQTITKHLRKKSSTTFTKAMMLTFPQ